MLDEKYISQIVENVLSEMGAQTSETRQLGVFDEMSDALAAVSKAYKEFRSYTVAQREKMISKIREYTLKNAAKLAEMGVEETGMGRVEDKTIKHQLVAEKTPGTEDLKPSVWTGDDGLTLIEMAPFGIIGSITPSTNPSETVICNSMGMIAGGNAVVFNPHPNAKKTSNAAVDMVNRAILEAGGPENLVVSVKNPTMKSSDEMVKSPLVKMLVATGGPGVKGASFDNNLPCIAEKECFVVSSVADELIQNMLANGAYMVKGDDIDKLVKVALVEKDGKLVINKKMVGRDAGKFLKAIGIDADPRLIICETDFDHPFVQTELMMPILAIVRVDNIDQAIEYGVKAEAGRRHSAHIHSKNIDNLTRFAREVETTIFVKNAPSYAGIGAGGEGYTTFTIAGPTGEGLTAAHSFTRARRCVMADGLHIV